MIQEKLYFFFDQFQIPEPQFLVDRRKTVAAGERTSPARLVINDTVFEFFQIFVDKRNRTQIRDSSPGILLDLIPVPVGNSLNLRQL